MIIYVDMEHPKLREINPEYWRLVCGRRLEAKYRFEEITGQTCYILHYSRFSLELLQSFSPRLVIFSGHNIEHEHYEAADVDPIKSYLGKPSYPTLCICGSFQLMAQVHGAKISPIGSAKHQDIVSKDPILPDSYISENGFCKVNFNTDESSALNFNMRTAIVHQHHFWEVKELPQGFRCRASSEICAIQALEHEKLPIIGVQFHPEDYSESYPDGRAILQTIVIWAKQLNQPHL